jgi:PIN like domain
MAEGDAQLEFFVDRSLGKSIVLGLRAKGLRIYSMADVYGERQAQGLDDEDWLRDAGGNDWIVLTKDRAIRRRPSEREALMGAGVRVFCLTSAGLRGAEQLARLERNLPRILRQARAPGPYIYGVYESEIRKLWPEG